MEISDIIPLIVIVGSIIYSVVSNINKKTKEQTAKTTLPGKTDVEFPEFFDDENYRDVFFEKEEIQEETIKTPIQPKKKNTLPKTDSIFIEDDESENFSFDFNDEDEMKKAIIYSEIFNRKA